jgi:hypothetical protein
MDLYIESDEPELRASVKDGYDKVVAQFNFPPNDRTLCFPAKNNDAKFMLESGVTNRGFRLCLADYYWLPPFQRRPKKLPCSVESVIRDDLGDLKYDNLVYLHGTTTLHPEGFIMTLAHELQHLRQHFEQPEMLEESSRIAWERGRLRAEFINVPHEKEAMFVAGKIAEMICGRSKIQAYVNEQLEIARQELVRWKYQSEMKEDFSLQSEMESAREQNRKL